MREVRRLWSVTGQPADGIATGGLRQRDDNEVRAWLSALREIGITRLHFAFAGHGPVHDRWNGRRGDFEWLMTVHRIGTELGFASSSPSASLRVFLARKMDWLDTLDTAGGSIAWRWAFPFGYLGNARRHERERIDELDRDTLAPRVAALCPSRKEWFSEREWLDRLDDFDKAAPPVDLILRLDTHNIDAVDTTSCDEIVTDLQSKAMAEAAPIPSLRTLGKQVGDRLNRRIYEGRDDIGRLWLDRFRRRASA